MTLKAQDLKALSHRFANQRKINWLSALGLVCIQFLPYLLLWDNAFIRIHDTLEGIDYQLLFRSALTFDCSDGAVIEQMMNGLPRKAMKTGWSIIALWHWAFGLYWGYILNFLVVHLTAFIGMYLILRDHLLIKRTEKVAIGIAVIFAWIPFFTMLGISVAGQPLLFWALLNIMTDKKMGVSWGIITMFPFYSDIVWAGFPLLLLSGTAWLLLLFCKTPSAYVGNEGKWKIPIALGWMTLLYLAINHHLFELAFLDQSFVPHRVEYSYFYNKPLSIGSSFAQTAQVFFLGHYHVGVFFSGVILMAIGWAIWEGGLGFGSKWILSGILLLSIFYGFYNWLVWSAGDYFGLLKSFKFERLVAVLPFLWLMVFALVLTSIKDRRLVRWLLATQLLIGMVAQDEFQHNLRQLFGVAKKPNFKAFFDVQLFGEIAQHIGQHQHSYKVITLGLHPSVAQYNGFYTLDGHASLYSVDYKHQFRKIMRDELPKNEVVQKEFDHFGNRCYLYSSELGKDYTAFYQHKYQRMPINELNLNTDALCDLNGDYLLSAVEVGNAVETGLRLEKVFDRPDSYWCIYLYEVMPIQVAQMEIE